MDTPGPLLIGWRGGFAQFRICDVALRPPPSREPHPHTVAASEAQKPFEGCVLPRSPPPLLAALVGLKFSPNSPPRPTAVDSLPI